jgi:hypothetical protein
MRRRIKNQAALSNRAGIADRDLAPSAVQQRIARASSEALAARSIQQLNLLRS